MNAQKRWKHYYRQIVEGMIVPDYIPDQRDDMRAIRREAALERRIASLERENAAHTMRVNGVIRIINDGAEQWEHVFDEETESCKYCGYEWPCQYETMRRALVGLDDANMILREVPHDKIEVTA